MESLTFRPDGRWRSWVLHGVLLAIVVAGPVVFASVVSGITSAVTFPLTQTLNIAGNRYEIFNSELVLIYLVGVIGVNLVAQAGLLTVGQSALFALGAYIVAIATTRYGWSFWTATAVAGMASGLVGLLIGIPSLRLGVFTLAMVTIGYAYVTNDLAVEWRGLTGGFDGVRGVQMPKPFDDISTYYWVVAAFAVVAYYLGRNLLRSPFGRSAKAIEQNAVAAQSLGIDVYRVKLGAFAISSVFAGVAGALYAPLIGFVAPDSSTVDLAILLLLMVLLGGAGTVGGPIVGTLLLFRIPIEVERVTNQAGDWSLLVYGVVLLASVYLFPLGVMSGWWWARDHLFRRRTSDRLRAAPDIRSAIEPMDSTDTAPLEAADVVKRLGGVVALGGLSLKVEPGSVHALIGPNGSGKTTFLNSASGFIRPDAGELKLFGAAIGRTRPHSRARSGLGRTFQTPLVFESISCLDNVMIATDAHRKRDMVSYALRLPWAVTEERAARKRAISLLTAVGLGERADDSAGSLPPGERRLLEIARTLALNPRAILMDEPAAGLSAAEINELESVIRTLKSLGIAVLLVEHHIDLVMRLADDITVIDFGKVIARGAPADVQKDEAVIAAYLGNDEDTLHQEGQAVERESAEREPEQHEEASGE